MIDLRFAYDLDRPEIFREVLSKHYNKIGRFERIHRREYAREVPEWKPLPDTTKYTKSFSFKILIWSLMP